MLRIIRHSVLFAGLLLGVQIFSHAVYAAGIVAPDLKPGQYVYVVPGDYDPPLIGKSGLSDIQSEARKRHFPSYVVVARDYGGSSTQELSDALDELVDNWAKNPKFDRATSSVAVLTYSPRKFRILPGSKWRASLGLEGQEGGQRFVDVFSSYVQGSSKDPKTGIIESMKSLDDFVFDQTDPKRIAQRAEAERKAAIERAEAAKKAEAERKVREVYVGLNGQISRVQNLLNQTSFLPADTSQPEEALRKAKEAYVGGIPAQMTVARLELEAEGDHLEQFVGAKRRVYQAKIDEAERVRRAALEKQERERREEEMRRLQIAGSLVGFLLLVGGLAFWQWRRFKRVSTSFREKTVAWDEALLNAANNHTRFFEERRNVTELATTSGKTKEKYDEVTREVGGIYPTIEAMHDRVEECKRIFATGSYFKVGALQRALDLLDADFEFDTETLNRKALFEPPVRIIKVKPAELRQQLEQTYAENIADWDELMQALKLRETIAQDAFPAKALDEMLELADQKGVPHWWLASHPLFGEEESDRQFYDALNAQRLSDPLDYKHKIDAALAAQSAQNELLGRLRDAVTLVESKRVRVLPAYGATVVAAEDDPAQTLAAAFRADESLTGFLATRTEVTEVEQQAKFAADLYVKAVQQATTLQAAIKGAEGDIANLASRIEETQQALSRAEARLQQARTVHANTSAAQASLESGRRNLDGARSLLGDSRNSLGGNRHLEAQRTVQDANNRLGGADQDLAQCVAICEQLDEQKRAYEQQVAQLAVMRQDAESNLRRYGQRGRLADFNPAYGSGPVNYELMMSQVVSYQQQMEDEVRRARRAYEEAQAQIQREQEAQRQRERDAERARSASSSGHSWSSGSSSSSSGSSWSSGGSSSSSGTDW